MWVGVTLMLMGCLLSLFSSSAMSLGVYLLVLCLLVLFVLCLLKSVWYGFLFFMMYVGGLLVLFFYVISLKSNVGSLWMGKAGKLSFVLGLVCFGGWFGVVWGWVIFDVVSYFVVEECSYLVFKIEGVFMVFFICVVLMLVLFLIGCFTSFFSGGIRPFS